MSAVTGRFAPSPSGRLHLGNLACSLLAWLSARSQGGRIVLRIEDLDAERCPRKYADALEEDLRWLGLVWDEGVMEPLLGGRLSNMPGFFRFQVRAFVRQAPTAPITRASAPPSTPRAITNWKHRALFTPVSAPVPSSMPPAHPTPPTAM